MAHPSALLGPTTLLGPQAALKGFFLPRESLLVARLVLIVTGGLHPYQLLRPQMFPLWSKGAHLGQKWHLLGPLTSRDSPGSESQSNILVGQLELPSWHFWYSV